MYLEAVSGEIQGVMIESSSSLRVTLFLHDETGRVCMSALGLIESL